MSRRTLPPLPSLNFKPNEGQRPDSADGPLFGFEAARLFTPPLVELNERTSYGFAVIRFAADVLGEPLDPWQRWLVIRIGELLPDGRPRFRQVLILVARQNGKTHLLKVLSLFWLFAEQWPLILGMSTNLDYAREAWQDAVDMCDPASDASIAALAALVPKRGGIRLANGEQVLRTTFRCRYKIAASNRKGGRSLRIDRLIIDELREHADRTAWNAAVPAMNARPFAQLICISNQGDDKSVVLDSLRAAALDFIETGQGDRRLGLFEYSAPDGSAPTDRWALAQANPNVGHRIDWETLLGDAIRAERAGGLELAGFQTEIMCMKVKNLDAAIDPQAWGRSVDVGDMAALRSRVALVVDVSPDMQHVTIVAGALQDDDRVRLEVVGAYHGFDAVAQAKRAWPVLVRQIKPRILGWLPGGPGAAFGAALKERKGRARATPPGTLLAEITGEVTGACMAFAAAVAAGEVVHSDDPLLTAHVLGAAKKWTGAVWRFDRTGEGHCDAAYAAAGAVLLARTLPTSRGKQRVVTPSN